MKKQIITSLLFLAFSAFVYAQNITPPSFPGGDDAFHDFLSKNLKWPDSTNIHGAVTVGFYVEKDGKLTNIHLVKKFSPAYDKEALRLISISPKWVPAMQQNKLIRASCTVPISFTVNVTETRTGLPDGYIPTETKFTEEDANKIYVSAEKAPSFPGGIQKFKDYVAEKLKNEKLTSADAGSVIVRFVVDRDGSLAAVRVEHGVSPAADAAAIRLLKASPKWQPAMMKGRPVRFAYTCPVEIKPNI